MHPVAPPPGQDEILTLFTELAELAPADRVGRLHHLRQAEPKVAEQLDELLSASDDGTLAPLLRFDLPPDDDSIRPLLEPDTLIDTPLGNARIEELISSPSRVGDTEVYRAHLNSSQRSVAIKILVGSPWSTERRRRFRIETLVQEVCEHHGVARLLSAGPCRIAGHEFPVIVMEFIEGTTFDRWADSATPEAAIRTLAEAASVVHHVNLRGVIHRDLKPTNIMVRADGSPTIVDFGVAAMLDSAIASAPDSLASERIAIVGTARYMAPEQFVPLSAKLDLQTDVYAFGCMLRDLISSEPAARLEGMAPAEIYSRKTAQQADVRVKPGLPPELATVAAIACDPDPQNRHESCAEFAAELLRALESRPLQRRPPNTLRRLVLFSRRRPVTAAGLVLAACAAAVSAGVYASQQQEIARQRDRATARFDTARDFANWVLFDLDEQLLVLPGTTPARQDLISRAVQALDELRVEASADTTLRLDIALARARLGRIFTYDFGDYANGAEQFRLALRLIEGLDEPRPSALRYWCSFCLAYATPYDGIDSVALTQQAYDGLQALDAQLAGQPDFLLWRSKVSGYQSRRMFDAGAALPTIRAVLDSAVSDARQALNQDPSSVRAHRALTEALFWAAHIEADFTTNASLQACKQAVDAAASLHTLGDPAATEWQAKTYSLWSRALTKLGMFDEAVSTGQQGVHLAERASNLAPDRKVPFRQREIAHAWLAQTCLDAARSGRTELIPLGIEAAQQSIELFQQRKARGWVDLAFESDYPQRMQTLMEELQRIAP